MSSGDEYVLDTGVLLYFLLTGQDRHLRDLVGDPLRVPRSVYDPDDRTLRDSARQRVGLLSEMRQSIDYYERAARRGDRTPELVDRVRLVDRLYDEGRLEVVDLTDAELILSARMQSRAHVETFGPASPLGAGEAACVAIAHHRGWILATDDNDALKALRRLRPDDTPSYERIRRLLIRGARSGLISRKLANEIHAEMVALGFWDAGRPFEG